MIVSPLFAKPEGTSESPSGANNWRQLCLRRPGYACVHTSTPLRGAPGITTMLNAVSLALCFLFTCAYAQTTRKLPAPTVTPLRGYPGLGCHRSLTHRFPGRQRWMPKDFYSTYEIAAADVLKYIIQHYNSARGHSYNNDLSPNASEKAA